MDARQVQAVEDLDAVVRGFEAMTEMAEALHDAVLSVEGPPQLLAKLCAIHSFSTDTARMMREAIAGVVAEVEAEAAFLASLQADLEAIAGDGVDIIIH